MRLGWVALLWAALGAGAVPAPKRSPLAAPATAVQLSRERLESLLQDFVAFGHNKAFRHIGDERDFDHGHLLIPAGLGRPTAILYHTQELALYQPPDSRFGWIDPEGRNWIQWIDSGLIENARLYERADYPAGGTWEWFQKHDLPALRRHRTILDKMLEPSRFGGAQLSSEQWVFTRRDCPDAELRSDAAQINVRLSDGERVCLALSRF